MKAFIKIANLSMAIPASKQMVPVSSLLTKLDNDRIKEYIFGTIAVKVGEDAFFLSPKHNVPETAMLQFAGMDGTGVNFSYFRCDFAQGKRA